MESVEPILVVGVAKEDLFRPLEGLEGLFLVPSEHLYLTSQVHTRELG